MEVLVAEIACQHQLLFPLWHPPKDFCGVAHIIHHMISSDSQVWANEDAHAAAECVVGICLDDECAASQHFQNADGDRPTVISH